MIKQEKGFTLVELMITMVLFVFVMAAGSQIFSGLLTQFKQQSKITETNIEGVVGLEMLRQDIEKAGYALPFVIPAGISYPEAINSPSGLPYSPANYNETTSGGTTNPPRAVLSGDGAGLNGSDVLIIKAVNVAQKIVTEKWSHLTLKDGVLTKKTWDVAGENFADGDYVMALTTGTTDSNRRTLVVSDGSFYKPYSSVNDFGPTVATEARYIYGLHDSTPHMPFNRADYYISAANVPQRCAANTGVLMKSIISHVNGALDANETLPLLDCVADMQVVFGVDQDTPLDGTINCYVDNLNDGLVTVDAENIRMRVKEVRIFLLGHEGQIDRSFNFQAPINPSSITVGETSGNCTGATVLGRDFNLNGITDWQNYRWKVYTMVVLPMNLR